MKKTVQSEHFRTMDRGEQDSRELTTRSGQRSHSTRFQAAIGEGKTTSSAS